MDQFVAEGYAQKLCIRYVSGRRNQSFFYFNHFRKLCNHPNLWFSLLRDIVTPPPISSPRRCPWQIMCGWPVIHQRPCSVNVDCCNEVSSTGSISAASCDHRGLF